MKSEKGLSLVKFVVMLFIWVVVLIVVVELFKLVLLPYGIAVGHWLINHGIAFVAGLQAGNPTAIIIAVLILVVVYLILRPRR